MAELFKFRCYQCQKLIGAPPSRFGSLVKCPKCGVELVVPTPDDPAGAAAVAASAPEPSPDPDAFRLEDIGLRIEPEPIRRPAGVATAPAPAVGPDPVAFLNRLDEADDDPAGPEAAEGTDAGDDLDLPEPGVEPLVPRTRGRSGAGVAGPAPRSRDVVLPRTAAVAWALFGLLALAFAFLAGLLLGQRLGK